MNDLEPISSSQFRSLANLEIITSEPTISILIIHFVSGQIWNITMSSNPPILLDFSTNVNIHSLTIDSLSCKVNNDGYRDSLSCDLWGQQALTSKS